MGDVVSAIVLGIIPLLCLQNVLEAKALFHHCLQRFIVLLNTLIPKK
jgi:hypothetical protein